MSKNEAGSQNKEFGDMEMKKLIKDKEYIVEPNEVNYSTIPQIVKLNDQVKASETTNKLEELINSTYFGPYQLMLSIILLIYSFSEGYCMLINSLVVPVLVKKWTLSEYTKSFMGGSIFLGFMFGSFVVGQISDHFGRKTSFIVGCCCSLISAILGIFISSSTGYALTNLFIGVGIGISVPSAMTLVTEITNSNLRARILGIVGFAYPTGGIAGCFLAKANETYNYQTNNWVIMHEYRCIAVCFYYINF